MLVEIAQRQDGYIQEIRQELHRIPELRYETTQTRAVIEREILFHFGAVKNDPTVSTFMTEKEGGIIADITFNPDLPRIGLRADFDALAVEEKTGLPFTSTHPGRMHACGHDVHTAWLLATLRAVLCEEIEPTYNLRFIFEDAEENPITPPGSELLIQEDVLSGLSAIYFLHIWSHPGCEVGKFYSRKGALLGNSGRLGIYLTCKGGHVAEPHLGQNGLRIQHEITTMLYGLPSRWLDPATQPNTLEPASCNAGRPDGKSSNIMPAAVESWWGVRTMLPRNLHEAYLDRIVNEVSAVVSRYPGAEVEFRTIAGHPATINNPTAVDLVTGELGVVSEPVDINHPPILGGESFAHYLEKIPGAVWMLGASQLGTGFHHEPNFNPDPSVFWKGVLFFLSIITAENK